MSQIIGTSGKITRGKSECAKNWPFSMKLLITVFRQLVIKFVTEVISWPVHLQHHTPLSSAICMLESLPSFLTWPFGIFLTQYEEYRISFHSGYLRATQISTQNSPMNMNIIPSLQTVHKTQGMVKKHVYNEQCEQLEGVGTNNTVGQKSI